jgi:hypothetical protein
MRALILASALALAPVAAWAQTATTFQPGPPTYDSSGHLLTGIAAAPLNAAFAGKADWPLSTVASGGLNPLPVGSPVFNWGQGMPTTATANVTAPSGFYVMSGPIINTNPMTYGIEDNAVGASVIANPASNSGASDNLHPQVLGSLFSPPSRLADFLSRDSVGLYVGNFFSSPLINDPTGTFDATHYFPSAGHVLTTAQISQLRLGMIIDVGSEGTPATSPNPSKWSGAITGWATNGTSITVQGWYFTGNTAAGQVPTNNTQTYVNPMTSQWGENINVTTPAGAPSWALAQGEEIDVAIDGGNTNPQITDANQSYGESIVSGGTFEVHAGLIINGKALMGVSAGTGSFAGFVATANASKGGTMGDGFFAGTVSSIGFESRNAAAGAVAFQADLSGSPTVQITNSGSESLSGTLTLGTIASMGPANFTNENVTFTNANFGGLTTGGISVSGTAFFPTGSAPSGACTVAGQFMGDTVNLYWCAGGVWRKAALAVN